MAHILLDTLLEAFLDSLRMLPFLYVAYLLIEFVERAKGGAIERLLARGGRWGFVPGAFLGLVPQCGFSAMAANFYGSRVISLGTLLAVFIATSDEAIPIMLAQPESYPAMGLLLACKLVFALAVGFVFDVLLRRAIPPALRGGYEGKIDEVCCHHHDEKANAFLEALKHALNIFVVVFLFTFAFGLLVALLGEGRISGFLAGLGFAQPAMAGLVGLIPNCASSVLLTQLYLNGSITFGAVLAGLSTNAGVGLTVLFRANRSLKQNLFIVGLLYLLGTAVGMVVYAVGLAVG